MTRADTYVIEGEPLQLRDIVKRCEEIAKKHKTAYFVGRETIRGRLRCGIRTWEGLTSRVASRREAVKNHAWRLGVGSKGKRRGHAPAKVQEGLGPAARSVRRMPGDSLYEPDDYVGPDESIDELLKGF